MITLKFTKIKNIILLANVLFATAYASPTTMIRKDNMNNLFNINNLETIGYIKVDEKIKNELLCSFHGNNIQSGINIFKAFFDIFFLLLMDKTTGNDSNIYRRMPVHDRSQMLKQNPLYELSRSAFLSLSMIDSVNLVTIEQFLIKFTEDQEGELTKVKSATIYHCS